MSKRAALYARVSSEDQGKGYSLPTQLEACRKHAGDKGHVIIAEQQDDCSGTLLSRPGLDVLRELAHAGSIDVIVVYEIDRLSRRVVHQLLIEEELRKCQVTVEYVQAHYEDTPEGQLQKMIRSTLAEYERAKIHERMERGKKGRVQAGNVSLGDQAPYGYRYVSEPHRGWLEIDEEEAEVVRLIYHLYLDGNGDGRRLGTPAIAQRLSELGIPTRRDTIPGRNGWLHATRKLPGYWSQPSVYRILSNETYCGVWHYNKRRKTSEGAEVRPKEDWIGVDVPPIISRETWLSARERAAENKTHRKHTKKEFLLEGRLRCDRCGMAFWTATASQYQHLQYYQCGGHTKRTSPDWSEHTCKWSYRREELDDLVWSYIAKLLKHPDVLLEGILRISEEQANQVKALQERIATIDDMLAALDQQRAKLLDLYLSSDMFTKDMLSEKQAELTRRRSDFEKERRTAEAQLDAMSMPEEEIEEIRFICRLAAEGLDHFTFARKKATLELFDVRVVLLRGETKKEDRLHISGRIPATDLDVVLPVTNMETQRSIRNPVVFASILSLTAAATRTL